MDIRDEKSVDGKTLGAYWMLCDREYVCRDQGNLAGQLLFYFRHQVRSKTCKLTLSITKDRCISNFCVDGGGHKKCC